MSGRFHLWYQVIEMSSLGHFFVGRFLIIDSTSLFIIALFRFSISSRSILGRLYASRNWPFFLDCPICWLITAHSSLLWSLIFLVMFPFSFIIFKIIYFGPYIFFLVQLSSVQSLSHVCLFATPWITARQASLSITNSRSLPKLICIESVMPSSHHILCRPLLLLPSIFPSIRVFSNESTLRMRWLKYWSFSLSISPSNKHPGLVSFRID